MKLAEQSPRIASDGTIRWYHGDTFILTLVFHLKDVEGNDILPKPTDKIEVFFKDYKNEIVAQFSQMGTSSIDINVDSGTSGRFIEGVYTINARLNGGFVTTLIKNSKVVVE